jgi:N6-L-threonylcarbamoyladenine synthase
MSVYLAIETSCDETAVAVVTDDFRVLGHRVASQMEHGPYGGVIPELAARRQLEVLPTVFAATLQEAGLSVDAVDGIAVTRGPGLAGSLLVGVSFAKGLAVAYDKPLLGVHHVEGHLCAVRLEWPDVPLPALGLAVSGGHTHLYYVADWLDFRLVARTRDDAVGEAFDKVAKMLGLGYPGGPVIDRMAETGDPRAFSFPIPQMSDGSLDFSFSGLKTHVMNVLKRDPTAFAPDAEGRWPQRTYDLLASFQAAAVAQLVDRTRRALQAIPVRSLIVAGGVASNRRLRREMQALSEETGIPVWIPRPDLCTDNAAMIGAAAVAHFQAGQRDDPLRMDADPAWELGTAFWMSFRRA